MYIITDLPGSRINDWLERGKYSYSVLPKDSASVAENRILTFSDIMHPEPLLRRLLIDP